MAKKKKLTKKELEVIQEAVGLVNRMTAEIGRIESSKLKLFANLKTAEEQLSVEQRSLEEKYGSVSIDLKTGELTDIE